MERQLAAPLRAVFERGAASGAFRRDMPVHTLAELYFSLLEGVVSRVIRHRLSVEEASAYATTLFLSGALAAPPASPPPQRPPRRPPRRPPPYPGPCRRPGRLRPVRLRPAEPHPRRPGRRGRGRPPVQERRAEPPADRVRGRRVRGQVRGQAARARRRRSMRASVKPTARAAASTVAPCADEVLGAFQPQLLLVPQRGEAGRGGEAAGEGAFADADRGGQVRQRQGAGVGGVDDVLGAVDGVARWPRCRSIAPAWGSSPLRRAYTTMVRATRAAAPGPWRTATQVQRQVDAAGDPRGGDDAAVDDVQHVADDGGAAGGGGPGRPAARGGWCSGVRPAARPGRGRTRRRTRWRRSRRRRGGRPAGPAAAARAGRACAAQPVHRQPGTRAMSPAARSGQSAEACSGGPGADTRPAAGSGDRPPGSAT